MDKYDDIKVPKGKALPWWFRTSRLSRHHAQADETVLFENIANGESLELMVPVATYKVDIVPTKETEPVYFGPVSLTVKGGAINRVYALGDPEKKTRNARRACDLGRHNRFRKAVGGEHRTGGQAVGDGDSLAVNLCVDDTSQSATVPVTAPPAAAPTGTASPIVGLLCVLTCLSSCAGQTAPGNSTFLGDAPPGHRLSLRPAKVSRLKVSASSSSPSASRSPATRPRWRYCRQSPSTACSGAGGRRARRLVGWQRAGGRTVRLDSDRRTRRLGHGRHRALRTAAQDQGYDTITLRADSHQPSIGSRR